MIWPTFHHITYCGFYDKVYCLSNNALAFAINNKYNLLVPYAICKIKNRCIKIVNKMLVERERKATWY